MSTGGLLTMLGLFAGVAAIAVATAAACRAVIVRLSVGYVITDPEGAAGRTAVVLGAGLAADGSPSPVLARRVEAAVDLYRRGHVERIVMSGDGVAELDQPVAMARYATALGVPRPQIELDHDGTDTSGTCRTAARRHVDEPLVFVTQSFHARRTAYLARKAGLDAVVLALPDADVRLKPLARARSRELPASVKAVVVDDPRPRPA